MLEKKNPTLNEKILSLSTKCMTHNRKSKSQSIRKKKKNKKTKKTKKQGEKARLPDDFE